MKLWSSIALNMALIALAAGCQSRDPFSLVRVGAGFGGEPTADTGARPWTHLDFRNDPDAFQFAIVTDRTGGHRAGVFPMAVRKLNLLQPEFVMSVGDLIEGYTEDEAQLREQWAELRGFVDTFEMPFFYVPGNHDISNTVMAQLWRQLFGRRYYAFVYRDVLFLCLDSQDLLEYQGGLGKTQIQWAKAVLAKHPGVRWTCVFMHQPLWAYEEENDRTQEEGWTGFPEVEKALLGRRYTVFAGHVHHYVKYIRQNRRYFTLATTGGASALRGTDFGEFDHAVWVTMTPDGPKLANLMIDGIHDENVTTEEQYERTRQMMAALTFSGIELRDDADTVTFENTINNPFSGELEVHYAWQTAQTSWSMKPAKGVLKIPAQGQATIRVVAAFDPNRKMPVPLMRSTVLLDGKEIAAFDRALQPLMRRSGVAVRVESAPTIDGTIRQGEYGSAPINGGFVDYRGRGVPEHQTRFQLAYDDQALYVAVIADETEPNAITVQPRQRDGEIWMDDSVELFIDATFDRKSYHQFSTNTRAVQFDGIGGPGHGTFGDAKWSADWQAAAKISSDRYVVEFAIPFKALGVAPPKPGDTWGFNVCRSRQAEGKTSNQSELSAWSIPYANFHVPSHFGNVTFQ